MTRLQELGVGLGLSHQLTAGACGLSAEGDIKAIHVLQVQVRGQEDWADAAMAEMAQSLSALHGLFIVNCGGKKRWAIYHQKRWFQSEWLLPDTQPLSLPGVASLDELKETWVSQLGQIEIEAEETLDTQIEKNASKARLAKRIEQLERKTRKEIQPRKQWKLLEELAKLRRQYQQL